jgi:hypothetical protein
VADSILKWRKMADSAKDWNSPVSVPPPWPTRRRRRIAASVFQQTNLRKLRRRWMKFLGWTRFIEELRLAVLAASTLNPLMAFDTASYRHTPEMNTMMAYLRLRGKASRWQLHKFALRSRENCSAYRATESHTAQLPTSALTDAGDSAAVLRRRLTIDTQTARPPWQSRMLNAATQCR